MRNSIDEFCSKLNTAEERISELGFRSVRKYMFGVWGAKMNSTHNSVNSVIMKKADYHLIGVPEEQERRNEE